VKRKRISKERLDEIHRQRLRELAEKAQAELDARKRESASQE
jgi:hypothetical protein